MNDLVALKNTLISRSYQELLVAKINIYYYKSDDAYFEFSRNSRYNYLIEVDKSLKKVKPRIIIGGLAHELSHIVKEIKLNFLLSRIDADLYDFSAYKTHDERKTDLDVVQRGYARELLAFTKYANKQSNSPYKKSDGLTVKELKKIIKLY